MGGQAEAVVMHAGLAGLGGMKAVLKCGPGRKVSVIAVSYVQSQCQNQVESSHSLDNHRVKNSQASDQFILPRLIYTGNNNQAAN